MASLDLVELVRNRTMSPEMAATLWATAEQRRSFLVVAIPRLAGKTTVMRAMLEHVTGDTSVRTLVNHPDDVDALTAQSVGGYLIVPEVNKGSIPGYIWGDPVRRVFNLLRDGYSLATSMHADGLDQAFSMLTGENEVADEEAAQVHICIYIRTFGEDWENPTRRVVAEVHEIDDVSNGRPVARLLHRWNEDDDRFEQVSSAVGFQGGDVIIEEKAIQLRLEAQAP